jgi:hypothetical protein
MTDPNTESSFRASLQKWLPWVVTGGVFAFIFSRIPADKVLDAAMKADLRIYLPLMTINILFDFVWDVLVFVILFRWFKTPVTFRGMLPIRGVTYLITLLNYVAGQGGMALIMTRWKKISLPRSTSVVMFSLFGDYYMLLALCLAGAFRLKNVDLNRVLDNTEEGHLVRFILISWAVFFATIWFFRGFLPRSEGWKGLKENELVAAFREATPAQYVQIVLLKTVIPLAGILTTYFALAAFDLHVPFIYLISMLPIVWLIEAIPISVMGMGTAQAAMIWLVARFAVDSGGAGDIEAAVLAYSILSMIVYNGGRFLIGAACVPFVPRRVWAFGEKGNEPDGEERTS